MSADDVALARDDFAGVEIVYVVPYGFDAADELVAGDHGYGDGLGRPVVPIVDVDIGAANGVLEHADEHVVDADLGDGHFFEPEAGCRVALHERAHGLHSGENITSNPRRQNAGREGRETRSQGKRLRSIMWNRSGISG